LNATRLLKRDHALVRALFAEYDVAKKASDRDRIMDELRDEIILHSEIEAEIFYPAVAECGSKEAAILVDEARIEHERMTGLLDDLEMLDTEGAKFHATFTALRAAAEHHAREEENGLFEVARRYLSEDRLQDLGDEMEFHKGKQL
jgi:hypothetical protein